MDRSNATPEPRRQVSLDGVWGYLDRLGAAPGEQVSIHVSASSAYEVSVVELGGSALLAGEDVAADRRDVRVLDRARFERAAPQPISPGSYVRVDGEPLDGLPLTVGLWLRLWSLPPSELLVSDWAGLISDFDYPERCGWGLLVNEGGQLVAYRGDGGPYREQWRHATDDTVLHGRRGEWVHVAASFSADGVRIFVDGEHVGAWETIAPPRSVASGRGPVMRIGATAEGGRVARHLDGDVAQPFVGRFALDADGARRLFAQRGLGDVAALELGPLAAAWPLHEERSTHIEDVSGNGRHGTLVGGGTWQIGGPSCPPDAGAPGYDPAADPQRGHGLRLCSDDLLDCAWDAVHSWTVPADARSDLYGVKLLAAGADDAEAIVMPFAVTRSKPPRARALALLIPTNTWHAYGRTPTGRRAQPHGLQSSCYSRHRNGRMYFELGTRLPLPTIDAHRYQTERVERTRHQHTVRPERIAAAWLRREGYAFACVTDEQLDRDPSVLDGYAAVALVGHSEYWSTAMRDGLLAYLDGGGNVFSMSGNTLYWRVSLDRERDVMEVRKTSLPAEGEVWGSLWLSRAEWRERFHAADGEAGGGWELLGGSCADVLGTTMAGLIEEGAASSYAPYEVGAPGHVLFHEPEPVALTDGRLLGVDCICGSAASGYEMDALPEGRPLPAGLTVLASARQPLLAPEGEDPARGAQIVHWVRPGGGEVLSTGSIAFAGSLPCDAPAAAFTRNVLARFGVVRDGD